MVSLPAVIAVALAAGLMGCQVAPTAPGAGGPASPPTEVLAAAQEQFLAGNYLSASELFARAWDAD